ncbi:MAG: hypothetical protein HOP18_27935 [Deltaproteobacteria bacterium]|nr:hypothetical protein [Deltaproteobacteria bacterium]
MNNHKLITEQSLAAAGQSSLTLRQWRRALHAVLVLTAIVVLAGCAGYGSPGGFYGYPGPYRSGGFYSGGVYRGYFYGNQHSIGRSGFRGGGGTRPAHVGKRRSMHSIGRSGFGGGGRRH